MRRWIVSPWDHVAAGSGNETVLVECDDMDEAAAIGLEWLQAHWDNQGSEEQVENVYVAPWNDRVAFTRRLGVKRSEMQCCGGPTTFTTDGHYATCPNHEREADEEPVEER